MNQEKSQCNDAQTPLKDLIESYRKCWCPNCKKSAWFEDWGGWRWCFRHMIREIRINETLSNKWFEFKKMRIRNPYNYPFKNKEICQTKK